MLAKHKQVFKEELGTMKEVKAMLYLKPVSPLKFFKPRPVPHALMGTTEQELDRMESMVILEKVHSSRS